MEIFNLKLEISVLIITNKQSDYKRLYCLVSKIIIQNPHLIIYLYFMDHQIRMAAFQWLEEKTLKYGDVLTRRPLLEEGFVYQGNRISLVGAKGIWKPRSMRYPISISTTFDSMYEDGETDKEGFLEYKYRGTDPYHPDNIGLREMMKQQIPLIYFSVVVKGKYVAAWPVYIQEDNMVDLSFIVAIDNAKQINTGVMADPPLKYVRRSYLTSQLKVRLHQQSFREKVLAAYRDQCALYRLKYRELLDAAHIISDSEPNGLPIVPNGLTLCKIHHAAFDVNIIGITPDYEIKVKKDVLEEIDGPMLKYGIQSMNGQKIILPASKSDRPDRDRLDVRYQQFLRSA